MNARAEQKAATRRKILAAAAALFRRDGYAATGVDAVMAAAGFTAGGFYAHFASKEELLTECLRAAYEESGKNLLARVEGSSRERRERLLDRYLSSYHRDHADQGCPLVGLASELARHGTGPARVTAEYLEGFFARLGELGLSRERAIAEVSRAVGALLMARLTSGQPLSDEILRAARPREGINRGRGSRRPSRRRSA